MRNILSSRSHGCCIHGILRAEARTGAGGQTVNLQGVTKVYVGTSDQPFAAHNPDNHRDPAQRLQITNLIAEEADVCCSR